MIKLGTSAKLPYSISRGSAKARFKNAAEYNNKLFNSLKTHIFLKEIPFPAMTAEVKKLANNIDVKIYENFFQTSQIPAKTKMLLRRNGASTELCRFDILLPAKYEYSNSLNPNETYVAFHETRHLFDQIFMPKITQRTLIANEKPTIDTKWFMHFYHDVFYTVKPAKLQDIKQKLNNYLAAHSDCDKVDILQLLRYLMTTEKHAFADGLKFQKKADKIFGGKTKDVITADEYNFPKKIKLVEKKLREVLNKMRKENAKQIQNQ